MLHDCRQFVSWDIWFIPLTSVTLIFNYIQKNTNSILALKIRSIISWRKVRIKSSQCDPNELGYTCATMEITKSKQKRNFELINKNFPSSDCRLQLVYIKLESLVIANQNVAVNTYLGLVHTARHMRKVNFIWRFLIISLFWRHFKVYKD